PNDESLSIDRPWNNFRTGETENAVRLVKSGIFHPRDFTAIYQREGADHHCLLRSSGDDDLIVMAMCASEVAYICCDGFAQFDISATGGVCNKVDALSADQLHPR